MSKGLKFLGVINIIALVFTLVYSISIYVDIFNAYDPSAGHTLGNLLYLFIMIYGLIGAGVSFLLSTIGIIIGAVKKQKPSIIFFGILLAIVVLFIIFVFVIGPKFLPSA